MRYLMTCYSCPCLPRWHFLSHAHRKRVHLDIRVGEGTNDYEIISKKEQLNTVRARSLRSFCCVSDLFL